MWTRSHSIITQTATKEQLWKLFADVNNWHIWDKEIEYAKMEGSFEKGNFFILKPKKGPKVKIELVETIENKKFHHLLVTIMTNLLRYTKKNTVEKLRTKNFTYVK